MEDYSEMKVDDVVVLQASDDPGVTRVATVHQRIYENPDGTGEFRGYILRISNGEHEGKFFPLPLVVLERMLGHAGTSFSKIAPN